MQLHDITNMGENNYFFYSACVCMHAWMGSVLHRLPLKPMF